MKFLTTPMMIIFVDFLIYLQQTVGLFHLSKLVYYIKSVIGRMAASYINQGRLVLRWFEPYQPFHPNIFSLLSNT